MANIITRFMEKRKADHITKVRAVRSEVEEELLSKANVIGTGIGYKINKYDEKTKDVVIRVYVSDKISNQCLSKQDVVPKKIKGIKTDVIKANFVPYGLGSIPSALKKKVMLPQASGRTGRYRPFSPGDSLGNEKITAGSTTIKMKVNGGATTGVSAQNVVTTQVLQGGEIVVLSNSHVECVDPTLDLKDQTSLNIRQPGPYDGGLATDKVATLARYSKIVDNGNRIDSAIAVLENPEAADNYIPGLGQITGFVDLTIGTEVMKKGRTTDLTVGIVDDDDASFQVMYGNKARGFIEQIVITGKNGVMFSAGGDSGSAIVVPNGDGTYKIGAQLFCGSTNMTGACKFKSVMSMMDAKLYNGEDDNPGDGGDGGDDPTAPIKTYIVDLDFTGLLSIFLGKIKGTVIEID
jgi:hypothetical protein